METGMETVDVEEKWMSLKVLAVLYDVLSHQTEAVEEMTETEGVCWRLLCLGAIDGTFMRAEQKSCGIRGQRESLSAAELDPLKELSAAAKHASIDPRPPISNAAKWIQKLILFNGTSKLVELRHIFMGLSCSFYISYSLYKELISRLEQVNLIQGNEGAGILAKVGAVEKARGVLLLDHLPLFTAAMRNQLEAYEGNLEAVREVQQEESSSEPEEELVPTGRDMVVPTLLLLDLVHCKRHGARRSAVHLDAYQRALSYLEGGDGETEAGTKRRRAIGYLRSAVSRKCPLVLVELRAVIGVLGSAPIISKRHAFSLIQELRHRDLISENTADILIPTVLVQCPVSPNYLRDYLDQLLTA